MHFLQRNVQSVLQAIVLPTHLCFSVCEVSDRNEKNSIFFPPWLLPLMVECLFFFFFVGMSVTLDLHSFCHSSESLDFINIYLALSEISLACFTHKQSLSQFITYQTLWIISRFHSIKRLLHFFVSFNTSCFQHEMQLLFFFFKDLTAHQPLVPLLLLPDLLLTSDWSWHTTASCWNQLAAMPGTKIDPVSLPALSDWSLICSSVTSSGLIFELSTTSWVHIALTTVCDRVL